MGTAPLAVLLVGRTGRNKGGGIARSAQLIVKALESVGDVCRLRSVQEPLTDIPSDTDLIWHYGDLTHIDQMVAASREAGVPILINSTLDDRSDRRNFMHTQMAGWDPKGRGDVFFAVFSHAAEHDVRLHKLAASLCAVPKTIDIAAAGDWTVRFGAREGICLGELEKLRRRRLVAGIDVDKAVQALQQACPGATLTVYDQYGTGDTQPPEGVTVVPKMGERKSFYEWLGGHRLFVSMVCHETFAMVPAEAQAVGVPVLFRHMPQSLSEHLGMTGLCFDSVHELAEIAGCLYHSQKHWEQASRASHHNAHARSTATVGSALSLSLRRLLARARHREGPT
jgi:hypothetical protein